MPDLVSLATILRSEMDPGRPFAWDIPPGQRIPDELLGQLQLVSELLRDLPIRILIGVSDG